VVLPPQGPAGVVYREDLDRTAASVSPTSDRMSIMARCHPMANSRVTYFDGQLRVACAECDAFVIDAVIARREDAEREDGEEWKG